MKKFLCDLQGKPFWFVRGHKTLTGFWSNYYKLAETFDPHNVWVTNIAVCNPVIVDCNFQQCGSMTPDKLKIYPDKAKNDFYAFIKSAPLIGTSDFSDFLGFHKKSDAIVLKNIYEGHYSNYPVYDVIVFDDKNLKNARRIDLDSDSFVKDYAVKRIDLSCYMPEIEADGIVETKKFSGYSIKKILDPDTASIKKILQINGKGTGTGTYVNLMVDNICYTVYRDKLVSHFGEKKISIEQDRVIDISCLFDSQEEQLKVLFL